MDKADSAVGISRTDALSAFKKVFDREDLLRDRLGMHYEKI